MARINGYGDSFEKQQYAFVDKDPFSGINYYRLSQTDYDGSTIILEERYVSVFLPFNFEVYPNPVHENMVTAYVTSQVENEINIKVYDHTGRIINRYTTEITEGTKPINIGLPNLDKGLYFAHLQMGNVEETVRFVKY